MVKKVLQLVECCNDCPRKVYYSGGRSECVAAGTLLPYNEGYNRPDWCPLIDYPSGVVEIEKARADVAEADAKRLRGALHEIREMTPAHYAREHSIIADALAGIGHG